MPNILVLMEDNNNYTYALSTFKWWRAKNKERKSMLMLIFCFKKKKYGIMPLVGKILL